MAEMKVPQEATNFENNGGASVPVPGSGVGTPTKAHPGTGAKSEAAWKGYGESAGKTWKQSYGKEPASWKQKHW